MFPKEERRKAEALGVSVEGARQRSVWRGDLGPAASESLEQVLEPYHLPGNAADAPLGSSVLSQGCLKSRIKIHQAHPAESSENVSLGGESRSSQTPRKFCLWGRKSPRGKDVGHWQMDRVTCAVRSGTGLLEHSVLANSTSDEIKSKWQPLT